MMPFPAGVSGMLSAFTATRKFPGCSARRRAQETASAALALFGAGFQNPVFCEQVHGRFVRAVGRDSAGKTIPGADALATGEALLPIAVRTADCLPVFLFSPDPPAVGLAHAGWRRI